MLDIALWIAGVTIGLFALDRLFLWMEARGWIYWRKVKSKSGANTCSKTMTDSGKILTG
jgi:hypothetical protein